MKKSILILLLLSFSIANINAQSKNPYWSNKIFRGGPILGLNFSQVDGDNDAGVHKIGMHAGLGSYISLSKRLGMQLDILFSQKGSRFGRTIEDPNVGPYVIVYKLKLGYIEMPFSLNYYYNQDLHFGVGASYNRLLSSEESYNPLYGNVTFDPEDYKFEKNTWDGFLSCSYRLSDYIRVELRYQRSITAIRNRQYVPEYFSNGRDQQNNLFVLRLGYYL